MNKAVGWAIGGAVLSITVGVLVGLVLHAGQMERADRTPPTTSAASADTVAIPPTDSVGSTGITYSPPGSTAPAPLPSSPPPAPPSTASPSTASLSTAPPESPDTGITSTAGITSSADITSTVDLTSTTGMTTSSTSAASSGTTPQPGADTAGSPCPQLAAKSGDAAGTTLFCQVDQQDRTLRWRAVVNRGGCLSQSMTGVGADGRSYACRLDDSGLNHWAPAT